MDPALHKALYPEHSYSDETYWADLRGRERLTWINKESVSVPPLGMRASFTQAASERELSRSNGVCQSKSGPLHASDALLFWRRPAPFTPFDCQQRAVRAASRGQFALQPLKLSLLWLQNNEARRELGQIWRSFKADPLAPFAAYWSRYGITGLGLFIEGYLLFSIGNLSPLYSAAWPSCWSK